MIASSTVGRRRHTSCPQCEVGGNRNRRGFFDLFQCSHRKVLSNCTLHIPSNNGKVKHLCVFLPSTASSSGKCVGSSARKDAVSNTWSGSVKHRTAPSSSLTGIQMPWLQHGVANGRLVTGILNSGDKGSGTNVGLRSMRFSPGDQRSDRLISPPSPTVPAQWLQVISDMLISYMEHPCFTKPPQHASSKRWSGSRERPDFIFGHCGPFTATSAVLPLPASRCPPCKVGWPAFICDSGKPAGVLTSNLRAALIIRAPEWPLASFDDAIVSLRAAVCSPAAELRHPAATWRGSSSPPPCWLARGIV